MSISKSKDGYPQHVEHFKGSTILITGGSGSWGNELVRQLLLERPEEDYFVPERIIIFSRGEISQVAMQRKFKDARIEYVIGDVRDPVAVDDAMSRGIDYVFHLAALKHVPICENFPEEAIKTNIVGTMNLVRSAIKYKVHKFIDVSTDKAVDPINVYGMTKGVGERLVIQANCLTKNTEFLCIRGGNVLGTNGSLVPHLIQQIRTNNRITLTSESMTRFFLTLEKAIRLLFFATEEGQGGETYVMNMPSFYIRDLAEILIEHYGNNSTRIDIIGKREGEKLHEVLISKHEVPYTRYVNGDYHVIYPQINTGRSNFHFWDHMEFMSDVYVPLDRSFTSMDNLRDKAYLWKLLQDGRFLK